MLKLDQILSFSDLYVSLESPLYRVFRDLFFGTPMPIEKNGICRQSVFYRIWGCKSGSLRQNFYGGIYFPFPQTLRHLCKCISVNMLKQLKMQHLVQHAFRDLNLTDFAQKSDLCKVWDSLGTQFLLVSYLRFSQGAQAIQLEQHPAKSFIIQLKVT